MSLCQACADNRESLRRWCWTLELFVVLGAALALFAGLRQRLWIIAGLALLPFLLRWSVARRLSRSTPFDVAWALLLLGAMVGLWASYNAGLSMQVLLMLLVSVSLYYVVANASQPRALAQLVVVLGLTTGTYFLTQYRYFEFQDKSVLASSLGNAVSGPFPRLGWWNPSPNGMASLLEGLVPVGVALAVAAHSRLWQIVGGVAAIVMGLALLVTASRGAWVALAAGMVLWLASRRRTSLVVLAVAVCVVIGAVGGYLALARNADLQQVPVIGPALHELFDRPDRLAVYRGSLRLIQDFPLTGIGLGDVFALVYSRYVLLIQVPFLTYSHNLYLTVWLGHGLLGVIGVGWLLAALVLLVIREGKWGHSSALFQAAWVGMTIILVHGLFDARQYVDLWAMWPPFALLGLAVLESVANASVGVQWHLPWRLLVGGTVALLGVCGVLMWRPLAAIVYANLGAVRQAQAELGELAPERKEAYLQKAVIWYERAVALDSRNRTAHLRMGNLLIADGQYEEGIALLEAAYFADPADSTTHKALGLAYTWVGRLAEARQLLVDVPDIVEELNVWGWWWNTRGEPKRAACAYRESLLLEPDQPQVQNQLSSSERE